MAKFIIYSLEIAISLALFYSAYWLFLKNETFFKLNRFYLLLTVMISLLTPLLNITIGKDSSIYKNLISPIEHYEKKMIGNSSINNEKTIPKSVREIASKKTVELNQSSDGALNSAENNPMNTSEENNSVKQTNWLILLLLIYSIGAAFFLFRRSKFSA
jgi:hypothetical protein